MTPDPLSPLTQDRNSKTCSLPSLEERAVGTFFPFDDMPGHCWRCGNPKASHGAEGQCRASLTPQAEPQAPTGPCEGCDLPNGCPEYCHCTPPQAPAAQSGERYFASEFEVWDGDGMQASTSGPREFALNEAMGYAAQYEQDGPVRVFEVVRHLVHPTSLHQPAPTPSEPKAQAQAEPHAYLCRGWGETDLPCVTIARSREEVRQFYITDWLGDENDTDYSGELTLPRLMQEFDEHDWRDHPEITYEFEIGGVCVERVYA